MYEDYVSRVSTGLGTRWHRTKAYSLAGLKTAAISAMGISLFLSTASNSHARHRPSQTTGSTRAATTSQADPKPVDLSTEKLAVNYRGQDIETVFRHLLVISTKHEFETTAEFEKRQSNSALATASLYTFAIEGFDVQYDADSSSMTISISPSYYAEHDGGTKWSALTSKSKASPGKNYRGTNGYGVSTQVRSGVLEQYELAIGNWDEFADATDTRQPARDSFVSPIVAEFPMVRAIARTQKKSIRVLAICSLASPFATTDTLAHEPTLSDPLDLFARMHYVHVRLRELWFYDISTGNIEFKLRAPQKRLHVEISAAIDILGGVAVSTNATIHSTIDGGPTDTIDLDDWHGTKHIYADDQVQLELAWPETPDRLRILVNGERWSGRRWAESNDSCAASDERCKKIVFMGTKYQTVITAPRL